MMNYLNYLVRKRLFSQVISVFVFSVFLVFASCSTDETDDSQADESSYLLNLELTSATLDQDFSSTTTDYTGKTGISTETVTVTPYANESALITVNDTETASGGSTDVSMDLGTNTITIVVRSAENDSQTSYDIDITRGFTAYLKASNTGETDLFGYDVAMDGDTVVVGAQREDSNATGVNGNEAANNAADSGAVYVFTKIGTTWSQEAYLKASNTGATDYFGHSVAISGNTIVIGAFLEDSDATGDNGDETNNKSSASGAAYVFTRSGSVWSQEAYLKASNTELGDGFGGSVAIDGDTIVIGATAEDSAVTGINGDQSDNSSDHSGAAYVFTRSGTIWSQQAYLKASNTGDLDGFGGSVAIDGDTIVVGASGERSNATGYNGDQSDDSLVDAGAVYIFTRTGTTWSQQAYLKASNTGFRDSFGLSVDIDSETLVVGAAYEDSNSIGVDGIQTDDSSTSSGAAYVFTRTGTTWSQQAYLKASNTDAGDLFGFIVAISNDNIVVGASGEAGNVTGINNSGLDNSFTESGAVYLFKRSGTTWSQKAYLKASNTGAYDNFGRSVAVNGDNIVVGAYFEDGSATGIDNDGSDNSTDKSGAAYIFY